MTGVRGIRPGHGIKRSIILFGWRSNGNNIGFHLVSKEEPDSFFLDRCDRGSGDSGEGVLGLSVLPALSSEGWVGDGREDDEDRREMYGGGRGFGCSSMTGELTLAGDVSNASDRSSRMARGGGRST